jgi:hypothetical protein
MRQQINLYQPTASQNHTTLSASSVLLTIGLLGTCLAGLSVYANQRVAQLGQNVQALRAQQAVQQQQVTQSGELLAARATPIATLEARVNALNLTTAERERALQLLKSGAAGQTSGFAARLEALARRHVAGLWLDSIQLSGTSPSMTLQGATTNPAIVPAYLQSLADEAVLSGTRFDQFVIQRPESLDKRSGPQSQIEQPATGAPLRFSAGSTSMPTASEDSTS